jgi:hypothetical protein
VHAFYLTLAPLRCCSGSLEHADPPASPERERPARLALRSIAGRVRRGKLFDLDYEQGRVLRKAIIKGLFTIINGHYQNEQGS